MVGVGGGGGREREMWTLERRRKSAYVSIRQHTSAYVSIRQHTSDVDLGKTEEVRVYREKVLDYPENLMVHDFE